MDVQANVSSLGAGTHSDSLFTTVEVNIMAKNHMTIKNSCFSFKHARTVRTEACAYRSK